MADLAETMDQAAQFMTDSEGKYLTLTLAEKEYGTTVRPILPEGDG